MIICGNSMQYAWEAGIISCRADDHEIGFDEGFLSSLD